MFNWFGPRCPLATAEKVWVETRMTWLTQQLSSKRLLEAPLVEPSDEFFPGEYRATNDNAHQIYRRVATLMQVDPAQVKFKIHDELEDGALGQYVIGPPAMIRISRQQLADPESLVGTIAHELAHHILLGGGLVQGNNVDLERLTDLLTVFLGLGIFGANSSLREQSSTDGQFSWWSLKKQGYLPIRMYAYAFALFAWARGEVNPPWANHLRLDVREPMLQGLRYVSKTGDSVFDIHKAESEPEKASLEVAARRLRHRSASQRFLGVWELIELGPAAASAADEIDRLLDDRDPDIPGMAAHALGAIGAPAAAYAPRLHAMLANRNRSSRQGAAFALGVLCVDDPQIVQDLSRLLDDPDRQVAASAIDALGNYGPAVNGVSTQLLQRFEAAILKCDFDAIDRTALALWKVLPDARLAVRKHFSNSGEDLLVFAEESLQQVASTDDSETRD